MSIKFTAWGYNNMDDHIAIKVQGVSKTFKDQAGATTIKNSFIELGRKIASKPEQHKKKGFTALKDINFEVKKGEFFGIVGRNGCGKSTLLKIMAGVYTPTKGAVVVNGKLTPFIELGVGFNPELSGRDNVFLNGALLGFNRKQMEAMYKDIIDFAELHEFMDMKLKNYSSGMQVRLAFSVAIRAESDILLIDEVLAVGDAAFQQKCFDYFERLKADNKTVVFVTHDMDSVKKYCDKALLIDDHKIKLIGQPETIADQYLLDNFNPPSKPEDEEPIDKDKDIQLSNEIISFKITYVNKIEISAKEKLRFKIIYELNVGVPVDIGIAIVNEGVSIMEQNTKDIDLNYEPNKKHIIEYELPMHYFNPGEYVISMTLFRKKGYIIMGFNHEAAFFSIKESGTKVGGLIPPKGNWIK